jgi:hypothetical protein
MECPHLRKGKRQHHCSAYPGKIMVPSQYESQYFCTAPLHRSCAWFQAELMESLAPGTKVAPAADSWMTVLADAPIETGACV